MQKAIINIQNIMYDMYNTMYMYNTVLKSNIL